MTKGRSGRGRLRSPLPLPLDDPGSGSWLERDDMTTHSSKIEVIWSPNKEEDLATYGTELRLYSVQESGAEVRRALAGAPYSCRSVCITDSVCIHANNTLNQLMFPAHVATVLPELYIYLYRI